MYCVFIVNRHIEVLNVIGVWWLRKVYYFQFVSDACPSESSILAFLAFLAFFEVILAREAGPKESQIKQICKYLKLRMKWKEIAELLGIDVSTLRNWRRRGEEIQAKQRRKSGLYLDLVEAIAKAEAELVADLSAVVFNSAFLGSETVTVKEIKLPDGEVRKETTIKRTPPNAAEARRILALMHPDRWAEVKHIKYEWKAPIKEIGLDPIKMEEMFFKHLEKVQREGGESPIIPELPGRTV